jgi:hypothetical protein
MTMANEVKVTKCEGCGCPLAAGHRFCSAICEAGRVEVERRACGHPGPSGGEFDCPDCARIAEAIAEREEMSEPERTDDGWQILDGWQDGR